VTTDLYELPLAPVASVGGFVRPLLEPSDYHFGYHSCWLGLVSPLPFITSEVFAAKPSLPEQWLPPEEMLKGEAELFTINNNADPYSKKTED